MNMRNTYYELAADLCIDYLSLDKVILPEKLSKLRGKIENYVISSVTNSGSAVLSFNKYPSPGPLEVLIDINFTCATVFYLYIEEDIMSISKSQNGVISETIVFFQ